MSKTTNAGLPIRVGNRRPTRIHPALVNPNGGFICGPECTRITVIHESSAEYIKQNEHLLGTTVHGIISLTDMSDPYWAGFKPWQRLRRIHYLFLEMWDMMNSKMLQKELDRGRKGDS